MCRLALNVAVLALITSLTRSDAAQAFPFSSWSHGHPTFEAVACRPPPWYRGFAREAPFVCAEFWGGRTTIIEIRAVSIITAASECTGCDVCYWHLADITFCAAHVRL